MQQLLAGVVHKPFPEIMRETTLDKIGMSHSTYKQPLPENSRASDVTAEDENAIATGGKRPAYPDTPAAELWTTPSDLARFVIELSYEFTGRSNLVLSREMARLLISQIIPCANGSEDECGYRVALEGEGSRSHAISQGGANANLRCYLDCEPYLGDGAVIMTNSDHGYHLYEEIMRSIAANLGWQSWGPKEVDVVKNPNRLDSYVRRYSFGSGLEIEVKPVDGRLFASVNDGAPSELLPIGNEEFLRRDDGTRFVFYRTNINQAIGLKLPAFGRVFEGKKIK